MSSRREVHAHLHQSNISEELRKTTQSDASKDGVPSVVDGLIGSLDLHLLGGWVAGCFNGFDLHLLGGWVDRFWVVLMGLICVCLVDGLIGSVCWV